MKFHTFLLFSISVLALVLSACAPAAKPTEAMVDKPTEVMMEKTATPEAMMDKPTETMMDKPTEVMMEKTATPEAMMDKPTETMVDKPTEVMMEKTSTPDAMMAKPTEGAMMAAPAWFGAALTNVSTGESFTVNDFKGKVVLVETMAQWCPNCKKQQMEVKALHEKMGMSADLVTIALDIDANENGDTLKAYAANNGFDWIYTVSPAEVSREIGNLYSAQFLNPPSTPILIIDRKGEVHLLPFGIKSADDLMKALEPYLNGM
jgi:thiol-disulfide isomerase/thioredoxin